MIVKDTIYIDGSWVPSAGSGTLPVTNSTTEEVMGSDRFVPIIHGRSSTARMGLFVHITADLIDIGSYNQWTLQLHAVQPVRMSG